MTVVVITKKRRIDLKTRDRRFILFYRDDPGDYVLKWKPGNDKRDNIRIPSDKGYKKKTLGQIKRHQKLNRITSKLTSTYNNKILIAQYSNVEFSCEKCGYSHKKRRMLVKNNENGRREPRNRF